MSVQSFIKSAMAMAFLTVMAMMVEEVSFAQTQTVVTNSSSRPAMVRDVDASSREPMQMTIAVQPANGQLSQSASYSFTSYRTTKIPRGKRFVIEYVSAQSEQKYCDTQVCEVDVLAILHSTVNRETSPYYVPLNKIGVFDIRSLSGNSLIGTIRHADKQVKIYCDGDTEITAQVIISPTIQGFANGQNVTLQMTISGYLEDDPYPNRESRPQHN